MGRKIAHRATGKLVFKDAQQRRRFEAAVAAGLSYAVIGRRFSMSPGTVKALAAGLPRPASKLTAREGGTPVKPTGQARSLIAGTHALFAARTTDHGISLSVTSLPGQVVQDPAVVLAYRLKAALRSEPPGRCIVMDAEGKVLRVLDPVTREEISPR